jgi:hypothetical protein
LITEILQLPAERLLDRRYGVRIVVVRERASIGFPEESFDAVVCSLGLMFSLVRSPL